MPYSIDVKLALFPKLALFLNGKAILRRTERAMMRAMCCRKVVDKKTTEEQKEMQGFKETADGLAAANRV